MKTRYQKSSFLAKLNPKKLFGEVSDSRVRNKCKWSLGYCLQVTLQGLLSGLVTSRELESFSEDLGTRVPYSTLTRILSKAKPRGLKSSLASLVKQAQREHVFERNRILPIHIVAIDGKRTSRASEKMSEYFIKGKHGKYHCRALRAVLSSVATPVFLGQRVLHRLWGEADSAIPFIKELVALYGRTNLLDTFSFDAGFASKEVVDYIDKNGLRYIQRIKGNQRTLYALLLQLFSDQIAGRPVAETTDIQNGKTYHRKLYRSSQLPGFGKWAHTTQAWCVVHEVVNNTTGEVEEGIHYYLTNLPYRTLSPKQILLAVRRHWAVETSFFNLDYSFKEDDYPLTNAAPDVVGLLRLIAHNLMVLYALRKSQRRKRTWSHREFMASTMRTIVRFDLIYPERCFHPFI